LQKKSHTNTPGPSVQQKPPGLLRRMAAIFYDAVLLIAVLCLASALALPFNSGEAFAPGQLVYQLYLFAVCYIFYIWFWTHGGQTLGLRTWKLKVGQQANSSAINWKQANMRFFAAILSWTCLGLGFVWCLFDKDSLCWHDRLSQTRLFFIDR
jgi:uncharacterized RDD family membrane protein YckC